jgi:hypothetical protein
LDATVTDPTQPSLFEQHAQTILTSIILAAIVGSGALLITLHNDVQIMRTQLAFVNEQLKQGVDDRFRGTDWRREKERLDERFQNLLQRVERLESSHSDGNHRLLPKAR